MGVVRHVNHKSNTSINIEENDSDVNSLKSKAQLKFVFENLNLNEKEIFNNVSSFSNYNTNECKTKSLVAKKVIIKNM
jgi:hypothetical protein